MLTIRTWLLAGSLTLLLTAPAPAQYGGMVWPRPVGPAFQVNPQAMQPAPAQQALYHQALYNQALYNPLGAGAPGLPNFLAGAASLTSTGAGVAPGYSYSSYRAPFQDTFGYPGLNPGYASAGVTPPYYYAPSVSTDGDTLRGLGDYTLAYGRYAQDYHKARLLNQDVERSKIETRRRLIEEWRYMQSLIPTAEEIRRGQLDRDLARARKQAPVSEILSGKSLNDLLGHLRALHAKKQRGPTLPLDEEAMKRLNVSTEFGGNFGLIRTGEVNWPNSLRTDAFTKHREKIEVALKDAFQRAKINGKVDFALMQELEAGKKAMEETLDKLGVDKLTMTQFMEARRYLNYLGDALRALQDPNVQNYFDRTYEARGKTVGDLIEYMNNKGLKFANSLPGDEGSYRMIYTYLVAYDEALSAMVSR